MGNRKRGKLPPRSDGGNAELFAWRHKDGLRFDHRQNRWLIWNGQRWIEDAQDQVHRLAKQAARYRFELVAAYKGLEDDKLTPEILWCLESENLHRIRAALELAKAEPPLSCGGNEFDADPWLLGVENGVVDLRNGKLRDGRPEDWVTLSTHVPFIEHAPCPRFERFLNEVFEGDAELVEFVWRALGYSLTGSVQEQCFFACYGTGANGKSTLLGAVHYVLGDYAFNLPFNAFEIKQRSSIPNDLVRLASRRFVTASETREGVRLNEQRIKTLTGGDLITARQLYKEFITFDPTHKLWLAFNHKPIIADDSPAMWRRVRMIPFNRRFEEAGQDKVLPEKLKAEACGILARAVRGCLDWQQGGLGMPRAVAAANCEYQEESDALAAFMDECCVVREGETAAAGELWQRYQQWTEESGEVRLSRRAFTDRLKKRGLCPHEQGHTNVRVWLGVGLRDASMRARASSTFQ